MAAKICPLCGNVKEEDKEYRLAIWQGDQRIVIIPAGTASYHKIRLIVEGTPDSYLMQETLDKSGRMVFTKRLDESKLVTDESGKYVERS